MGDSTDWTLKEGSGGGGYPHSHTNPLPPLPPHPSTKELNSTVELHKEQSNHNCVVFSLKNQVGGLARALKVFQDKGVNVIHIESRKSRRRPSEYEIMVDVDCDNRLMDEIMEMLSREVAAINLQSFEEGKRFPRSLTSLSSMSSFGKYT